MSAGAYKGLTIRIGADTTKLSSALRGADSAIFKTQQQLNKLTRAARMDPGNIAAMNTQVGVLANQAVNAAVKVSTLREGMDKLGSTALASDPSKTINDLAKSTDNAVLSASRAKVAYESVVAAQSKLYKQIKESTGVDIHAVTNAGKYSREWLENQDSISDSDKAEIERLKDRWEEARAALDDYTDVARLESMSQDIISQEASINQLNRQIVESSRNLATYDRYASSSFSSLGNNLAPVNERLVLVSSAAETASERFRRLDTAMNLDYGGMNALIDRTDSLNNAIEAAELKAELLQERIDAYDNSGVGKLVDDMGNVAIEVEQSERAFIAANTNLERLKATGDTSSETFRQMESAVEQARLRMDTAHACQQYQNLKTQIHEVRSEAIELANKLVDINRPSTVAASGGVRKIASDIDYIDTAMRNAEGGARSLDAALKLNPNNTEIVERKTKLLADASKLAAREAADLKKQLESYDVSAIDAVADSSKTAAEQVVDAGESLDRANQKVRDTEMEMARLQDALDKLDPRKNADEFSALSDQMLALMERLYAERDAAKDASDSLDMAKQREEVDSIRGKMVENIATTERLAAASRALANISMMPKFDVSFADQMRSAFDEMSSGRLIDGVIGNVASKLKDIGAASDDASGRLSRLDAAMELDPTNVNTAMERARALADATSATDREMGALKLSMASIPSEMIDRAAIASGTVAEKVSSASRSYDEATNRAQGYQDAINALNKELDNLEHKDAISEEDAQNISNIKAQIELLTASMQQFAESDERAFNNMASATATQKYQEMGTRLAELKARAKEFADSIGKLKVSSDISNSLKPLDLQLRTIESGIQAAKGRFDALGQAAQIRPYSLKVAVDHVRALREATDAARQKAENLKRQLDAYKASGIDKLSRNVTDAAVAFEKAQANVNRLQAELAKVDQTTEQGRARAQELQQALARAMDAAKTASAINEYRNLEAELHKVQSESQAMKNSMRADLGEVGSAAVMAAQQIGQLVSQAWSSISSASNDVDASYRNLRKTFDAEEDDYQRLYDAAMKYSQGHVTSADTMLEMEATAAQLGVGLEGGAEAIQKFADAAANLDVATDIDAGTIALQMGQIMNVMSDVNVDNIDKFGDALVRLGNNMPTQESNIMQITQRLSAIGDVAGFTTPQLLGWASAIASTGQKSEAAASGIATTITKISTVVDSGGDDLEKFAKVAGKTAEQFAADWKSNPSDALQDFMEKLGDSEQLFADLMDLDIKGVRQTQTLAALAQTVGKVNDAVTMADDAFNGVGDSWGAAGDAAREAERKADGFSGSLSKMQNSAQVLAATIGPSLVPIIDWIADRLQWLTKVVDSWSDDTKRAATVAAGGFLAFNAVWPVVSALGSNLMKFASGTIGFVIKRIATFGTALTAMNGGIFELASGGSAFAGITTAVEALGGAGALATGALGALALVLGGVFIAKMIKAKMEADRFNGIIEGISGSTDGLAQALESGSTQVGHYGQSWRDAKVDMDEFLQSMEEHNRVNKETRDSAIESTGMLNKYKDVINQAAGAGDKYEGSMAKLQWAIDGLNEALGTSYEANEILKGTYEDAEGAVRSYKDEINELIEAKKREIKLSAYADIYAEDLKALEKANRSYDSAKRARREYTANYVEENKDKKFYNGSTGQWENRSEDQLRLMAHSTSEWKELDDAVSKTRASVRELGEQAVESERLYDGALKGMYKSTADYGVREGIMQNSDALKEMAEQVGITGSDFDAFAKIVAQSLEDCGVSTDKFASLDMAKVSKALEESGGDVETFINKLLEISGTDVDVNMDTLESSARQAAEALGLVPEEVMTRFNIDGNVIDGSAKSSIDDVVTAEGGLKSKDINLDALGNVLTTAAASAIRNVATAESRLQSKSITLTASGNALSPDTAAKIWNLVSAANSMRSKTVELVTNVIRKVVPGSSATGAYIPYDKVPRHAAGIFTRPTLTNIGWVGEDGAELYSGNSLIPLTNRKYSMPYINDISDAVAKKLGGSGTTYNISIDGTTINDDPAIRAAFMGLMGELARKGAMNVG